MILREEGEEERGENWKGNEAEKGRHDNRTIKGKLEKCLVNIA